MRPVWGYLDGEGALVGVRLQVDLHGCRVAPSGDQLVPQLLQRIAAVGDQLPDEDLPGNTQDPRLTLAQNTMRIHNIVSS